MLAFENQFCTWKELKYNTNLCAECQLIAQSGYIVLQQIHQALEEGVVLTLHVCIPGNITDIQIIHYINKRHNNKQTNPQHYEVKTQRSSQYSVQQTVSDGLWR